MEKEIDNGGYELALTKKNIIRIFAFYFVCVSQLMSSKQSTSLMSKDKEFYAKQLCQLETKLRYADDKIVQLNEQLERTKQAREELFTEYVASRLFDFNSFLTIVQAVVMFETFVQTVECNSNCFHTICSSDMISF